MVRFKFLFAYLPFLAAALAFASIVLPSRLGTRGRAVWAIVLLLAASRGIVFETLGGNLFTPNFPEPVVWAWYLAGSSLVVLLVLRLVWWTPCGRTTLMPAIAVALTAWGMWEGIRPPPLKEVEVAVDGLPRELDGYRIAQVSDLHCSSMARGWRTRAVVDAVNAAKPDLVCLTGDYVDGDVADLAPDMEPLASLSAKDGVWCVTGNHEYYQDSARWRRWYRRSGFRFLANECVRPRPGLALAGVNDAMGAWSRTDVPPDVGRAFAGCATNDFRILLSHRPRSFRENVRRHGVGLQLSGHTHGGIAPGAAMLVAKLNGGFVRGLYREGRGVLYVSPGAGLWAGFPLRFFNPSEITLFVLTRK